MGNQPSTGELRSSFLFAGFPDAVLSGIAGTGELRSLAGGQRLWAAGEKAGHVGVVVSGRLKMSRRRGARGREIILDIALPGDVVGDVAFAVQGCYVADVVALRRSRLFLVPEGVLRRAFADHPRALSAALVTIGRRAQRLILLVEALSAGSVQRRLAAILVTFAERAGAPFPGGLLVPLRLHRAELAALAATSKESVSRVLAAWQRAGALTMLPASYVVHDLEALRRAAAGP